MDILLSTQNHDIVLSLSLAPLLASFTDLSPAHFGALQEFQKRNAPKSIKKIGFENQ